MIRGMTTLTAFLKKAPCNDGIREITLHLASTGQKIRDEIHISATKKDQAQNATGDTQSALDLTTDRIIKEALRQSDHVTTAASEEQENCYDLPAKKGSYFVAYDPYDGGSIGDTNISFGSIFGIWKNNPIAKKVGTDLVAACYIIYGPRVIFVLSIKGHGVQLFELNNDNIFLLVTTNMTIAQKAKHVAPGNLRASLSDQKYRCVIDHWLRSAYTLRYTGAFVTDINHIILKGDGIFTYPAEEKYPAGRLRLLYECAPLTLIVQEAGGSGQTQNGTNILNEIITDHHQRTTVIIGSSSEVETITKLLQ